TLNELYEVVMSRKNEKAEGSYTCYLFEKGLDKILKKVGEESTEVVIAAKNVSKSDLAEEIADLTYHLTVLCVERGLTFDDIQGVLQERTKKLGNLKKFHNVDKNS
ncbi:MAG: phosphoribosyl-ATP diphosphatase, partial [Clostridia bacterium]|nr:phosphoribosyl-ATP diphosphatase [Clostridia bacterium]